MDLRLMGFDHPLFHQLHNIVDYAGDDKSSNSNAPSRTFMLDAKAMAATPADVKEYPNSYVFIIDMPGMKSGDIKVQIDDDNLMRKFVLPENANKEKITAVCQDGVLIVTVEKLPPPQPKKPRTIERFSITLANILISIRENPQSTVEEMDLRLMGFDHPLFHHIMDYAGDDKSSNSSAPSRTFMLDAKAMAATPADVKEYPNSMERRVGKLMRKFVLPENANKDKITAVCQDGVLTVTVEKLPPPEPKKPRTIEVAPAPLSQHFSIAPLPQQSSFACSPPGVDLEDLNSISAALYNPKQRTGAVSLSSSTGGVILRLLEPVLQNIGGTIPALTVFTLLTFARERLTNAVAAFG
nr:17.3 kDa class II heat shock protein-like [Ipomoea batatas]